MGKEYMGKVTDRDMEMVNLLIDDPTMSLEALGSRLGVTKQAVAERKAKIEQMGYTKSYYFWNMTPRFEGTKRVLVGLAGGFTKMSDILRVLDNHCPILILLRTDPERFFSGGSSSLTQTASQVEGILHLQDEDEERQLKVELEELGVQDISIEPMLFWRLLGERCDIALRTPERVKAIASNLAREFAGEASVQAVLFEEEDHPVDQFDLIVIRDERFQPEMDSYERRVDRTIVDYHFTNLRHFMGSKEYGWLRGMRILYTRDESTRRKLQGKIDKAQT